jgi:hypothetical protein
MTELLWGTANGIRAYNFGRFAYGDYINNPSCDLEMNFDKNP